MKLAIIGSGQCRKLLKTQLNKAFETANKDFYFQCDDNCHYLKMILKYLK